MSTRTTIEAYFDRLGSKSDWQCLLSDDVVFTSLTTPGKSVTGKEGFLEATRRFYGSVAGFELCDLIVEGNRACAVSRYTVQPPTGAPSFESHVAEIFTVHDGKIETFAICFDTAPYPK